MSDSQRNKVSSEEALEDQNFDNDKFLVHPLAPRDPSAGLIRA